MKESLSIYCGSETTEAEVQALKDAFGEAFDVTIHKTIQRFSDGLANLIVQFAIGIASGATLMAIKTGD